MWSCRGSPAPSDPVSGECDHLVHCGRRLPKIVARASPVPGADPQLVSLERASFERTHLPLLSVPEVQDGVPFNRNAPGITVPSPSVPGNAFAAILVGAPWHPGQPDFYPQRSVCSDGPDTRDLLFIERHRHPRVLPRQSLCVDGWLPSVARSPARKIQLRRTGACGDAQGTHLRQPRIVCRQVPRAVRTVCDGICEGCLVAPGWAGLQRVPVRPIGGVRHSVPVLDRQHSMESVAVCRRRSSGADLRKADPPQHSTPGRGH